MMPIRNRRIFFVILLVAGALSSVFFTFGALVGITAFKTIERSHEIQAQLSRVSGYVDGFKEFNNRLPTQVELKKFLKDKQQIYINNDLRDPEAPDFLKDRPVGSFFLSYWRGEWAEFYAGWSGQSTLVFDQSLYYPFDSITLTMVAILLSLSFFFFGLRGILPRGS